MAYTYTIEYRTSISHGNADALSQLPLPESDPITDVSHVSVVNMFNIGQIEALPLTCDKVQLATSHDPILSKVLNYIRRGWPAEIPDVLKPYYYRRSELTIEANCLLWGIRVIIPNRLRQQVLQELHCDHPGVCRMKSVARSYVWWPKLGQDLEQLTSSCVPCQAVKQSPPAMPLHPWIWPSRPWQQIHVDFAGPFLGKMFLLFIDAKSKWPEIHVMTDTTASKTDDGYYCQQDYQTIKVMRLLFAQFGLPEQLVSDNGPQFVSEESEEFLKAHGVMHLRSTPYHPATNGAVERLVRTFKQSMKAALKSGASTTLQCQLQNFLLSYRTTPHTTTQKTPAVPFLGQQLRTRLDLLQPDVETRVASKQAKQKGNFDVHKRNREIQIGDHVLAKSKSEWIPGTVIQRQGPLTYLVDVGNRFGGDMWIYSER